MPDRTLRGRPVDDRSAELKRRKLELQAKSMDFEIARNEVSILEHEHEIDRLQETIAALEVQRQDLLATLSQPEEKEGSDG